MLKEGITPDEFVYSAMVGIFCQLGDIQKALKLMDVMRDQGLAPSVFAYNSLLKYYIKEKDTSSVMSILNDMISKNLVNQYSFGYALEYLYLQGPATQIELKQVIDLWKKQNMEPSATILSVLLAYTLETGSSK